MGLPDLWGSSTVPLQSSNKTTWKGCYIQESVYNTPPQWQEEEMEAGGLS